MARWAKTNITVVVALILFGSIGAVGIQGKRKASRQAELKRLDIIRSHLDDSLDNQRRLAVSNKVTVHSQPLSQEVSGWASTLNANISRFRSKHPNLSASEAQRIGLCNASLNIAQRAYKTAISGIDSSILLENVGDETRVDAERMRADAYFDAGQWDDALQRYQQLEQTPSSRSLIVYERIADCKVFLQQTEESLDRYADLATLLQDRGERLLDQVNIPKAVEDFSLAVRIRYRLFEDGKRRNLANELAQSFSSCGKALIAMGNFEKAKVYLANAIEVRSHLVRTQQRHDLSEVLAADQKAYESVVSELQAR